MRNVKTSSQSSVLQWEVLHWEYLSAMNKVRYSAVAEVLPSTRKSV